MKRCTIIISASVLLVGSTQARTMVYNFRVAQITKEELFNREQAQHHTVMALVYKDSSSMVILLSPTTYQLLRAHGISISCRATGMITKTLGYGIAPVTGLMF